MVYAFLGFVILLMATVVSLAAPIVLGSPFFLSNERETSDRLLDKVNVYFNRILEIIPDMNEDHLWSVIRNTLLKHKDASLEHVVDTILEKIGDEEDERQHVECGCCFSAFPFVSRRYTFCAFSKKIPKVAQEEMVQCPETHLFCSSCMNKHASNLLGSHNPDIRCIDQSGCVSLISASELQRFLSPKMLDLWERAQSRRALESAGLENLHYCPFCDWACIIEGQLTGILICRNKAVCGRSSCIRCGKLVRSFLVILYPLSLSFSWLSG